MIYFRILNTLKNLHRSRLIYHLFRYKKIPIEESLYLFFTKNGGISIKIGQFLSTREDIFDKKICKKLSKLQDNADNKTWLDIKKILDENISSDVLSSFEKQPFAQASIAQIHKAKLKTGEDVAIKIIRPQIRKEIQEDLLILKYVFGILSYLPNLKLLKLNLVFIQIQQILDRESNLNYEAMVMTKLYRNSININIPKVILSTENVLIMTYQNGSNLSKNLDKIDQNEKNALAKNLIFYFLDQIFIHEYFHGDIQYGNLLYDINNPYKLTILDFGMSGHLRLEDKYYLYQNSLALINQDYSKIVDFHIEAKWVNSDICREKLIIELSQIISNKLSLKNFKDLANNMLRLASRFNISLIPQLVLLQKSIVQLQTIINDLNPDINIIEIMNEYKEKNHLKIYHNFIYSSIVLLPSKLFTQKNEQQKKYNNLIYVFIFILIIIIFIK